MAKLQKLYVLAILAIILAGCKVEAGSAQPKSPDPSVDLDFPVIPRDGLKEPFSEDDIAAVQTEMMTRVSQALSQTRTRLSPAERANLIASVARQSPEVLSATPNAKGSVGIVFSDGTPFIYMEPRPTGDGPEPSPIPDPTITPSPSPSSPAPAPTTCPGLPPEVQWPPGIPCPDFGGDDDWGDDDNKSRFHSAPTIRKSTAAAASHILSDKAKAVLVDVDGLGNVNTAYLTGLFQRKGYAPKVLKGTSQELRTQIDGVNFLWMASHSAPVQFEIQGRIYSFISIQIGDPAASAGATCQAGTAGDACRAIQRQNRDDEQAYRIFRGAVDDAGTQVRWFITRAFIGKYWKFVPESIAIMDICSTGSQEVESQQLRGNLHLVNAHTVAGWTTTVSVVGALPVIKRFIDRMLGTNEYVAPTPKQRPFSAQEVHAYMADQGLTTESYSSSKLVLDVANDSKVILVPSIKRMDVDEQEDTLTLIGEFGTFPKKVTIGGTEATVKSWKTREIKVGLPQTGAGSFGDVVIESESRKSNAAPLTQWIGKIRTRMTYKMFGSPGPWTDAECSKMKIRGDIHKYRDLPGQETRTGLSGMKKTYFPESAKKDFSCKWSAGGQGVMEGGQCRNVFVATPGTLQWSPNYPEDAGFSPYRDNYFFFVGNIDIEARKLIFLPNFNYHFRLKTYCKTPGGGEIMTGDVQFADAFNGNGINQNWSQQYPHSADSNWNFPATEMAIPDLQGMPNVRTLNYDFPSQAIPTDDTEA